MDDLNKKELLEELEWWYKEFNSVYLGVRESCNDKSGINRTAQAYTQLVKIAEEHFREPVQVDEEKIRFDIPTCHHAYKMLDKAENLWCDDCVIRAIDTVAEQLLTQRPMQVDEELIERTLEELSECCDVGYSYTQDREWGELDKEKAEAIIRQLLTQKRVVTREKELQNGRARQIKSINKT